MFSANPVSPLAMGGDDTTGEGAGAGSGAAAAACGAPHFGQNPALGATSAPHFAQNAMDSPPGSKLLDWPRNLSEARWPSKPNWYSVGNPVECREIVQMRD